MAGAVDPAGIEIVDGVIVTLVVSLLFRVTVVPPAGAAKGSFTANGADCPGATVRLLGMTIVPALITVMLAVVSGAFGSELA